MNCPFCAYEESKVIDSRPTDEGQRIRRRRECLQCAKRFTTYEIIESLPIIVIKKDKSRETFNRNKIMTGLLRACEKRPVSIDMLDKMIDEIVYEGQSFHFAKQKDLTGTSEVVADNAVDEPIVQLAFEGNTRQEIVSLPSEYQQVEYIESTGTQYINTGIFASENNSFEAKSLK